MVEDHFSLVVIDSIMALFRVDFTGRGELSERQQVLGKTLSKCDEHHTFNFRVSCFHIYCWIFRLMKVSEQFNVAVVYTNHVMSDPAASLTFVANPSKPIGGD